LVIPSAPRLCHPAQPSSQSFGDGVIAYQPHPPGAGRRRPTSRNEVGHIGQGRGSDATIAKRRGGLASRARNDSNEKEAQDEAADNGGCPNPKTPKKLACWAGQPERWGIAQLARDNRSIQRRDLVEAHNRRDLEAGIGRGDDWRHIWPCSRHRGYKADYQVRPSVVVT
jgi:hypothetical protein